MNVRVTIEVSTPPTASNLDNLRSAASELTNNLKSIVQKKAESSISSTSTKGSPNLETGGKVD
jgi:hypothetical protein